MRRSRGLTENRAFDSKYVSFDEANAKDEGKSGVKMGC